MNEQLDSLNSVGNGHSQEPVDRSRKPVTFHVPQHADVHLDVEYRQRLHAVIPTASLSQLQTVLLRLMGQQAAQQLAQMTSSLFHQYLPFAFTSPTTSTAVPSDSLSSLRPALVPFTRDFLREAEKGFTETARYALTEQLDHITDFEREQHSGNDNQSTQHTDGTQKESVTESNRSALARWLHQITQHADRAQLLTLTAAFDATTAAIAVPAVPVRSTSLPPTSTSAQSITTSAGSTAPLTRTTSLSIQPAAATRPSPSRHDVLVSGGMEPLCVILSYLPFSSLCVSTSLVSRRFFTATNDPRCWRLLRSLGLFACPPPPLLSLLLHKAQRLTHLSFPPVATNAHLTSLAAHIDSMHLSERYLLDKEPFPLTPYLSHLTSLDLSGCIHLTDAAFIELTTASSTERDSNPALPVLRQMEHVKLSGCSAVTDVGFCALFAHLPSLLSLDLSNTGRISLASFIVLTDHCGRLSSINLSSCRSANDSVVRHVCTSVPALQSLLLSSCWSLTAQSLLHLPASLTELDVSGCSSAVSDKSVRSIALTCHGLTALSVRGCVLTDAGLDIVLRGCRRLQLFDAGIGREGEGGGVSGGTQYTDMLLVSLSKFARSLSSIVLTSCAALTDRGVLTLAQSCPSLSTVNFANCPLLTNLSLLHMADSPIAANLTAVTFSHCHRIDDHGTAYLVNKATALITLRVAQCIAVTDRTLQFLSRRLSATGCGVREVDLFRCPVTDRGLVALGGVRRVGWTGLSVLLLGNCMHVSDEGVRVMAAVCIGMKELSLYGCNNITDASLQALGQHCSQPHGHSLTCQSAHRKMSS